MLKGFMQILRYQFKYSEEAVPGPSVFPSGEPRVSGDFWGSQEGCQGSKVGHRVEVTPGAAPGFDAKAAFPPRLRGGAGGAGLHWNYSVS